MLSQKSKINNEKLRQIHNDLNGEMGLPPWITDQKCANCHHAIEPSAIRGVSLCTNARNLGNISVEICCTKCSAGYEMHFRVNCLSLEEFIEHLKIPTISVTPVPDFKIEKWDNNLIRHILQTRNEEEIEEKQPPTKKD